MKNALVIGATSIVTACLLTACGASTAAPANGAGNGSSAAHSGKDPAGLDPCTYITDDDLAAGVDAVYGAGASGLHSNPESTPSDDNGADTSPSADSSGNSSAIPTDWQYARLSVSNAQGQLPGYSKKECHVQVSANEGDLSSLVRVNVWDFHVYFAPPDTYRFYKDEGADPVTIPGADQAESFEEVIMVKNGWTVISGGQQAEKLVIAMLSRMAGRLPS